jgi:acylaminoacyl-peptidase
MVQKFVADYLRVFSRSSIFSNGWLRLKQNMLIASVQRNIRGLDEDRVRTFQETFIVSSGELVKITSNYLDVAKPVCSDLSPSGARTVSFYNTFYGAAVKEDKPIIEVITNNSETFRIDASEHHGKVIGDAWFGGCSWSSDELFVTYVAETKQEKKTTFFSGAKSTKFDYVEDWGEKYEGVSSTQLFVLDISKKTIIAVPNLNVSKFTFGQPVFAPFVEENKTTIKINKYVLVYTAWLNEPRKLGMIYCFQRPCCVFATDLTSLLLNNNDNEHKNNEIKNITENSATEENKKKC